MPSWCVSMKKRRSESHRRDRVFPAGGRRRELTLAHGRRIQALARGCELGGIVIGAEVTAHNPRHELLVLGESCTSGDFGRLGGVVRGGVPRLGNPGHGLPCACLRRQGRGRGLERRSTRGLTSPTPGGAVAFLRNVALERAAKRAEPECAQERYASE
jgi:hypothetical protein